MCPFDALFSNLLLTVPSRKQRFLTLVVVVMVVHVRALHLAVDMVAILLRMADITAGAVMGHLLVATARAEMTIVVERLPLEMITTREIDTAPLRLLEGPRAVLHWMILTLLLVAAIPMTAMALHHLVVGMKNRMAMGTIGAPDPRLEAMGVDMKSVRATGDCFPELATSGLIAYHDRTSTASLLFHLPACKDY